MRHCHALVCILQYMKTSPGRGLLFLDNGYKQVRGYANVDWAGCPFDKHSTSGYWVMIGGNLISWKSKKQPVVARSSSETEYLVRALVMCELVWMT